MHDDTFNKKEGDSLLVFSHVLLCCCSLLGCTMRFNFNEACVILSTFATRLRFDNILGFSLIEDLANLMGRLGGF